MTAKSSKKYILPTVLGIGKGWGGTQIVGNFFDMGE